MSEPITIVCAHADAPRVVAGSVFHHSCANCGHRLMLAPSGQAKLRERPDAILVCGCCIVLDDDVGLVGTVEQLINEALSARPNLRRNRN